MYSYVSLQENKSGELKKKNISSHSRKHQGDATHGSSHLPGSRTLPFITALQREPLPGDNLRAKTSEGFGEDSSGICMHFRHIFNIIAYSHMGHGQYLVYSSKSSIFQECIIVFQLLAYK